MKKIIFIFLLFSIGIFAQNKIKVTKSAGNVGTKTVDETAIGDGKYLVYDSTNSKIIYTSAVASGTVTSIIAGTGISVNQATGDVTITNTGGGGSTDTTDALRVDLNANTNWTLDSLLVHWTLIQANFDTLVVHRIDINSLVADLSTLDGIVATNISDIATVEDSADALRVDVNTNTTDIAAIGAAGVTSIIAGTGISVSSATGDVTITYTGGGGTSYDHSYYLEEWGLVGDGVTNDSPAWQTMADSITARGGIATIIFEENKTYNFADSLMDLLSARNIIIVGNNATISLNSFFMTISSDSDFGGGAHTGFWTGRNGTTDLETISNAGNLIAEDMPAGQDFIEVQDSSDWEFIKEDDVMFSASYGFNILEESWTTTSLGTGVSLDYDFIGAPSITISGATGTDTITVEHYSTPRLKVNSIVTISDVLGMTDLNGTHTVTYVDETGSPSIFKVVISVTAQTYASGGTANIPIQVRNVAKDSVFVDGTDYEWESNTEYSDMKIVPLSGGNMFASTGYIINYYTNAHQYSGVFVIDRLDSTYNPSRVYFKKNARRLIPKEAWNDIRYVPCGNMFFTMDNLNIKNGNLRVGGFELLTVNNCTGFMDSTTFNSINDAGIDGNLQGYALLTPIWAKKVVINGGIYDNCSLVGGGYGLYVGWHDEMIIDKVTVSNNRHGVSTATSTSGGIWGVDLLIDNCNSYNNSTAGKEVGSNVTAYDTHAWSHDLVRIHSSTATGADQFAKLRSQDMDLVNCKIYGAQNGIIVTSSGENHTINIENCEFGTGNALVVGAASTIAKLKVSDTKIDGVLMSLSSVTVGMVQDATIIDSEINKVIEVLLTDDSLAVTKMLIEGGELNIIVDRGNGTENIRGNIIKDFTAKGVLFDSTIYRGFSNWEEVISGTEWRFIDCEFTIATSGLTGLFTGFYVDRLVFEGSNFNMDLAYLFDKDETNTFNNLTFTYNKIHNTVNIYQEHFLYSDSSVSIINHNEFTGSAGGFGGLFKIVKGKAEMKHNDFNIAFAGAGGFIFEGEYLNFENNTVKMTAASDSLFISSSGVVFRSINNSYIIDASSWGSIWSIPSGGTLWMAGDTYSFLQGTAQNILTLWSGSIFKYGTNEYTGTTSDVVGAAGATVTTFSTLAP